MTSAGGYTVFEDEAIWEDETATWEGPTWEDESDQFLPLLGLAASALPGIFRAVAPAVKRLIPAARRAVGGVVRAVAGRPRPPAGPGRFRPAPVASPPGPIPRAAMPTGGRRRETVSGLLRRLARVLGEGEAAASAAEASFFGSPETQFEVAAGPAAHEAALTEVLAAEAAHSASLEEAQALLGAALPVTIRIMGGARVVRPYLPALTTANTRLVRSLATGGPEQRQLLRLVPTIHRRAVASLAQAGRAGRPVPAGLVPQIVAGQAARVLATPRLVGPALIRNTAVRRTTVAPPIPSAAR